MRPVRTKRTNLHLVGGPVGSDLGDMYAEVHGPSAVRSVWELAPEERTAIAAGANLALWVGVPRNHFPPVKLELTDDVEIPEDAVVARLLGST